jgi:hypothetical protein
VELTNFKLKNRHFWNFGEKYYRVEYVVKVVLGAVSRICVDWKSYTKIALQQADIRFELWFRGKKYSKDNPIQVNWEAAEAPTVMPPQHNYPQPEQYPYQNGQM